MSAANHQPFDPSLAVLRPLLRIPLFYKILIANAAIVVLGTVVGTAITAAFIRAEPGQSPFLPMTLLAVVGVAVTVLVNAAVLRIALSPLKVLEETAARVRRGDLDARAPLSAVGDPALDRLTRTFNAMLDALDGYRQRLRDVAARALNAEEEERKRIARELHDETAQALAALLIRLRLVRSVDDQRERDRAFEEMRSAVTSAIEGVRRFARGLRPPALDELGLVAALESHVRALQDACGTAIELEADPLGDLLPPSAELGIYRIVQEALSNAIRHSGATHIAVRLVYSDGVITATVIDNGHGFRAGETMRAEASSGLGLFGMQERAAYLGGRVRIRSRPGAGTEIRADIPVRDAIYAPT